MSKLSSAELQFGLAVIGRANAAAKSLIWKRSGANQLWCETDGFRLTLTPGADGLNLHLGVEGADATPVFSLSGDRVAVAERRYVEEALSALYGLASQAAEPLRPALVHSAETEFAAPLDPVEEAKLARLVRRLGAPRAAEAPRRRWFTAPRWGMSPEVVPLTGQA